MTTKITVDAHADWPVEVEVAEGGNVIERQVVYPGTTRDLYLFADRALTFREISKPVDLGEARDVAAPAEA